VLQHAKNEIQDSKGELNKYIVIPLNNSLVCCILDLFVLVFGFVSFRNNATLSTIWIVVSNFRCFRVLLYYKIRYLSGFQQFHEGIGHVRRAVIFEGTEHSFMHDSQARISSFIIIIMAIFYSLRLVLAAHKWTFISLKVGTRIIFAWKKLYVND